MTKADSFRVGNIGELYPKDIKYLVEQAAIVLVEMGILTQEQIAWTTSEPNWDAEAQDL
jgi:hypothetical protein